MIKLKMLPPYFYGLYGLFGQNRLSLSSKIVLSQPGPEPDGEDKVLAEIAIKKRNRPFEKFRFKMHCSSAGQLFITLLWFTFSEHQGLLFLGNVGKSTTDLG